MLINLRNALMAGKRLPYDAEVEFLKSTGTQWIDTGVVVDGLTFKMQIDLQYASVVSSYSVHGQSANDHQVRFGCGMYNSKWYFGLGNKNYYPAWFADANRHILTLDAPGGIASVDSNVLNVSASSWEAYTGLKYPLSIFARSNQDNGLISAYFSGKVYYCKIWQNGILIRDYIPVRKGTVGYLYDRVSGKLFGNAGTGDFQYGQDVVPVEYIESHGTEYIDTGFKASNSTRVAVDFEQTNVTANSWILGARNGTSSATDKFALFCGNNSSYAMIGSAMGEFSSVTIKTGRHLLNMSLAGGVVIDSQIVITYSASEQAEVFSAAYAMVLFNLWSGSLNNPFVGKYYACDFWDNGDPVRRFRPIRVGTDATSWAGAMMDTLTRRIYRNAGTGAFAYGNDLKYPIPAE